MIQYNVYERYSNSKPYSREFAIRDSNDYHAIELESNGFISIHKADKKNDAKEWLNDYLEREDLVKDEQIFL